MFIELKEEHFDNNAVVGSIIDINKFHLQMLCSNDDIIYYLCSIYTSDNYVALSKEGYDYVKKTMLGGIVENK